jgi:transposase-like protein
LKDAFPKPKRRCRRVVAVDETKLKPSSKQLFVWAAADVKNKGGPIMPHLVAEKHHAD